MGKVEEFSLPIEPLEQSPRTCWIYLPDSYEHTDRKFDVLYMFDGHNLFFDEVATYGKSWGLKDYLDRTGADLVVVGQDCNHIGDGRMHEYTPLKAIKSKYWGEIHPLGDITARWFVKVLKPYTEEHYRVYSDRSHVGIGGSSMGGLMAEYCIAKYNDVYSKAACVSSASGFCMTPLKKLIKETEFSADTRIYMSYGTHESPHFSSLAKAMDQMLELNHLYTEKGCTTYPHLLMNGTHAEASWETLVPVFLPYLYPNLKF